LGCLNRKTPVLVCTFIFLCFPLFLPSAHAQTRAGRQITVGPSLTGNGYFGQWVIKYPGWDRYLMFYSINSAIGVDGKPTNGPPYLLGTYNDVCSTYWGDRIWMTWHFGDGKNPADWGADDGSGNTGPFLILDRGEPGGFALIGDPTVVIWEGQFHMYYEGTDQCDGNDNRIFHATAPLDGWFDQWEKQGEVVGLIGGLDGSAISWPTALVENGNLYLYYNDGCIRIRAAIASDTTGHNFTPINYNGALPDAGDSCFYDNPKAISPEYTPRAQVARYDDTQYIMIYEVDRFTGGKTAIAFSDDKFDFPAGRVILSPRDSNPYWEDFGVGLPSYFFDFENNEHRIYYTGETLQNPPYREGSIGVHFWPETYNCNDVDTIINGTIDLEDFALLAANWLIEGWPDAGSDITGNGYVDIYDLEQLIYLWASNCS